ncbi:TPA: hypothetical protein HA265_00370 [Candidatus Woesearchaeota archaeon]|nr:hypothetical protein [Candidatus Woesearchaeota archaeon]
MTKYATSIPKEFQYKIPWEDRLLQILMFVMMILTFILFLQLALGYRT